MVNSTSITFFEMNIEKPEFTNACPTPYNSFDKVMLSHGGGGKISQQMIQQIFFQNFNNEYLNLAHDGAMFSINGTRLAFSTDSYVVQPIFFPGGNIGEMAINGTVNDIACCGAKPLFISVGFILEEGFPIADLQRIVESMGTAARNAGVQIVTGDTKVVERGKGDKIFINTSGIGLIRENANISPKNCKPDDVIIINGKIAEHGMAIMSARNGLEFETTIVSDTCALNTMIETVLNVSDEIHVLRDPTRGGLASSLNEICQASDVGIVIDETQIPISEEVQSACELLGFDPLYVANEGKILIFAAASDADKIIETMKQFDCGRDSCVIGFATAQDKKMVRLKTSIGSHRIVDMISGEQLPRIC